jgi:hypothetical protein
MTRYLRRTLLTPSCLFVIPNFVIITPVFRGIVNATMPNSACVLSSESTFKISTTLIEPNLGLSPTVRCTDSQLTMVHQGI